MPAARLAAGFRDRDFAHVGVSPDSRLWLARGAVDALHQRVEQAALRGALVERKIVHDEVAAAGLVSESEGEPPHRRVVVQKGE